MSLSRKGSPFPGRGEWRKDIPRRGNGMCKAEMGAITWYIQVNTPLHATDVKKGMWEP